MKQNSFYNPNIISNRNCSVGFFWCTIKSWAILSRSVAHLRIFRLFMREKFDAYVWWPLAKRIQNWIVDWSTPREFMVIFFIKISILHWAISLWLLIWIQVFRSRCISGYIKINLFLVDTVGCDDFGNFFLILCTKGTMKIL